MTRIKPIILLILNFFIVSGCGTGADEMMCPNTESTAQSYKKFEPTGWVWRICNTNSKHAMEEIDFYGEEVNLQQVGPCECSTYFSSEKALIGIDYKIKADRFNPVYLDHYKAVRGIIDSTQIRETPGRYIYYISSDTSEHFPDLRLKEKLIIKEI